MSLTIPNDNDDIDYILFRGTELFQKGDNYLNKKEEHHILVSSKNKYAVRFLFEHLENENSQMTILEDKNEPNKKVVYTTTPSGKYDFIYIELYPCQKCVYDQLTYLSSVLLSGGIIWIGCNMHRLIFDQEMKKFISNHNYTTLLKNDQYVLLKRSNSTQELENDILYCDGSCSYQYSNVGYGSVVDSHSNDMIGQHKHLFTDILLERIENRMVCVCDFKGTKQQNNGAELLAFVCACRIVKADFPKYKEIRCDSQVVLDYWSKDSYNAVKDGDKLAFIKESVGLRHYLESLGVKFTKISGDENLADLGKHKRNY
jgi:ribonuclease HI